MKYRFMVVFILMVLSAAAADAFQADGLIEPHRVINLGSPQRGIIATVEVERGDAIKAGQVLATLQSEVEQAQMQLKKANKDFADRKKDRLEPLFKQDLLASINMDEAETIKAVADAEYRYASAVYKRLKIDSPISGVVVERFLSPGEYVENQPIMKLAEIDPLNVEVVLPLDKYRFVKPGMKVRVIPEKPMGGQYYAVVTIVDKVIDAASGTFGVRLNLPNPGHHIPAGIKCKVIIP